MGDPAADDVHRGSARRRCELTVRTLARGCDTRMAHAPGMLPHRPDCLLRLAPPELPELLELQTLAQLGGPMLRQRLLCEVDVDGRRFPVHAYHLGS